MIVTLAVDDLRRALAFYSDFFNMESPGIRGAEFRGDDTNAAGAVAMFELDGDFILALYPRKELAKDARIATSPSSSGEFSIGRLVGSKEEVDNVLARAKAAGATITDPPHERPWGIYSGYFSDLDGHLWEIIWNPE